MGPDIPELVAQLGWPAVTLVFFAWVALRIGKFMGPLMQQLIESHVSMMTALETDAKDKTKILGACKEILQSCHETAKKHTVQLDGISEQIDAAL